MNKPNRRQPFAHLLRGRGPTLASLLCLSLFLTACKESPGWFKVGPLFSAEEQASPGKSVVYVYWLQEERGRAHQIFVRPCGNYESQAVFPGGYASFVVEAGPQCLQAERGWEIAGGTVTTSEELGEVDIWSEAGRSSYVRLARKPGFFGSNYALRRVEPDAAAAQIRQCRRSIPLTPQEILAGDG
jgi:hypothetical protein